MATNTQTRPEAKSGRTGDGQSTGGRRSVFDWIPGPYDDFGVPHLGWAIVLIGGVIFHNRVRSGEVIAIVTVMTSLGMIVLPFVTWSYADDIRLFQRTHATLTPVLAGAGFIGSIYFGFTPVWGTFYICAGTLLGISWNVRRAEVIKNPDQKDSYAAIFGLPGSRVKKVKSDSNLLRFKWFGTDGQTQDDLLKVLPKMESALGAVRGAIRMIPGGPADQAEVIVVKRDQLKRPPRDKEKWDGNRRSIAEGITIGMGQLGNRVKLVLAAGLLAGATHLAVMGMTRAGKSHMFKLFAKDLSRTNDAVLWVIDPLKGAQTLATVMPAIDWAACGDDAPAEALAMFNAVLGTKENRGIIKARGDYLGARGHDDWVPGCGLPALILWIEEAAMLNLASAFTKICAGGLSVGVFVVTSMQRMDHSNIPTTARSQFAEAIVFGVNSETDSGFLLPEDIHAQSVAHLWKQKKPGMFYLDGPHLDTEQRGLPGRTFKVTNDQVAKEILANAPGMARLDELSAQAAGQAYLTRAVRSQVISGSCPVDPSKTTIKYPIAGVPQPRKEMSTVTIPDQSAQPSASIETLEMEVEELEQMDEAELDKLLDSMDETYIPPAQTPLPYTGAEVDMKRIDESKSIPPINHEVVFEPPSAAPNQMLRGQARHERWVESLARVAAGGEVQSNGDILITTEDLWEDFFSDPRVPKSKPWVHGRLNILIEAGLCTRVEPEQGKRGEGKYMLTARHDWLHPSPPVAAEDREDEPSEADNAAGAAPLFP